MADLDNRGQTLGTRPPTPRRPCCDDDEKWYGSGPFETTWSRDMPVVVYAAAGAVAAAAIGYGVYKAYKAVTAAQQAEEVKQEGLGTPDQADAGVP